MNRVTIFGNLTRDPELRHTGSNTAICTFCVAVNRKFTNAAGERKEETTFVDCEAWGKTAELIAQYFHKGKPMLLEGRLKLDQWEDKATGQKRSKLMVVCEGFEFVGNKEGDSKPSVEAKPSPRTGAANNPQTYVDDTDIPF